MSFLRPILIIGLTILISALCVGQTTPIEGLYQSKGWDPSFSYEFFKDGSFKYTRYGHLGITTRGKGKYQIENDSIYFEYEKLARNPKLISTYNFNSDTTQSDDLMIVKLGVYQFQDSLPIQSAWVGIQHDNQIPNPYFLTDKNGELSFLYSKTKFEDSLIVRSLGRDRLVIPLDTFKTIGLEIKAYLKWQKESTIQPHSEKYPLQVISDTSIRIKKYPYSPVLFKRKK